MEGRKHTFDNKRGETDEILKRDSNQKLIKQCYIELHKTTTTITNIRKYKQFETPRYQNIKSTLILFI